MTVAANDRGGRADRPPRAQLDPARAAGLRRAGQASLFVGPTMLILLVFSVLPIVVALVTSFTDLDLRGLRDWSLIEFVGLDNYTRLLADPRFRSAAGNTVVFVLAGVPLIVVCSLAAALMVNYGSSRLFRAYRALFFLPAITNIVAVAFIWGFLYNTDSGLINLILSWGGVGPLPWLDQPVMAKISVIIVAVWQGCGYNMLIFVAALQGIPREFYEAAQVDGANAWRRFWSITLPQLRFATFFVAVTTSISWIQLFETPLVLTHGGPLDSTVSMALFIYRNGFERNRFGYGSAASFLLFLVVVTVTAIQFRLRRRDSNV
ncbi:MAG: sugar ABC transporter permease [Propionibacteriaceae bacterium]|jgi:multiple sugar transport system permease protein|nr:sugar ABC transporter permease [Propionibacteriaceae bacterium]